MGKHNGKRAKHAKHAEREKHAERDEHADAAPPAEAAHPAQAGPPRTPRASRPEGGEELPRLSKSFYEKELARLQLELIKLQEWVRTKKLRVVVIFEGRDAAGKGGVIKRIIQRLNPRVVRVVALPAPTERERTQWYFQRYVAHLPAGGEIVLFDRSWYNRAGVEHVMGFCTEAQHEAFLRSCPQFERMLVRSGIKLLKYWFSVSDEEQQRRFQARIDDPTKRWKLSPIDLEARRRWVDYSMAKDVMFAHTDIKQAPWFVVEADQKRRARLNCIRHLLGQIDYQEIEHDPIELPVRQDYRGYVRPPMDEQTFVPDYYRDPDHPDPAASFEGPDPRYEDPDQPDEPDAYDEHDEHED